VLSSPAIGKKSRLTPQIEIMVRELLAVVKSSRLLKPSIAYEIYSIVKIGDDLVRLENNATLHGSLFHSVLSGARKLTVAVYTIGSELEDIVTQDFKRNESLRGALLDGIGNAALELLKERVCKLIRGEAASYGYQSSSPISPGMPGFPLSEQGRLFELVPAQEIGLVLTPPGMMVPLKSISAAIGMGPQMPTWSQTEACTRCSSGKTCPYRVKLLK